MRGGVGYFLKFKGKIPHHVLRLLDPLGLFKASPEKKAQGLLKEINNGRAAMLGVFGLVWPQGPDRLGLDSLPLAQYPGEYMAPFSSVHSELPYVADMLKWTAPWAQ